MLGAKIFLLVLFALFLQTLANYHYRTGNRIAEAHAHTRHKHAQPWGLELRHNKHDNTKFPKLAGVLSRLDHMKNDVKDRSSLEDDEIIEEKGSHHHKNSHSSHSHSNKHHHQHQQENNHKTSHKYSHNHHDNDAMTDEDYEEDHDQDQDQDQDDLDLLTEEDEDEDLNMDDLDEEDNYLDEEDDFPENEEDIEDVHFEGYQNEDDGHRSSPITVYKWKNFGTKDAIDQYRSKTQSSMSEHNSALEHFMRMSSVACGKPMARVVQVRSIYPNPSKTYMPHCTVLHRCGEDTGCCTGVDKKCGPKETEIVDLYFLVRDASIKNSNGYGKPEKLSFVNHTKCECQDKSGIVSSTPESLRVTRSENHRCKCPEMFTAMYVHNSCVCDCLDTNSGCLRMKRGKEHFSLVDRVRILHQQVTMPKCEYGIYEKDAGKCPRKQDKFDLYTKVTPPS